MNVARILARARQAGARLLADGDKLRVRADGPLAPELVEELRRHKVELLGALRDDDKLAPWRRRIDAARCWDDLHGVLSDAQVAFAAGELAGETVEVLAELCAAAARDLPQYVGGVER